MNREEIIKMVQNEVLTAPEVIEYLEISKQSLSSLVKRGKLVPIKEVGSVRLFLRCDVEERKKEAVELKEKYRPYD